MPQKKFRRPVVRRIERQILHLGLRAKPAEVVEALGEQGVEISEELVARVKLKILQDQLHAAHVAHHTRNQMQSRNGRRLQKIPQKRPWRR